MVNEAAAEKAKKILKEFSKKVPGNNNCADCGQKQPGWASTNIGCLVCIRCSGVHRNMGVHISKVKSITLDSWPMSLVKSFKSQGGNKQVNSIWEKKLKGRSKPNENTSVRDLERFIRDKYQRKEFYSVKKAQKFEKKRRSSEGNDSDSSSSDESEPEVKVVKKKIKNRKTKQPKQLKRKPVEKKIQPKIVKPPVQAPVVTTQNEVEDLLDFSKVKISSPVNAQQQSDSLLDSFMDSPTNQTNQPQQQQQQQQNSSSAVDNILSAFNKPPSSVYRPQQTQTFGFQQQPQQPMNNFGQTNYRTTSYGQQQQPVFGHSGFGQPGFGQQPSNFGFANSSQTAQQNNRFGQPSFQAAQGFSTVGNFGNQRQPQSNNFSQFNNRGFGNQQSFGNQNAFMNNNHQFGVNQNNNQMSFNQPQQQQTFGFNQMNNNKTSQNFGFF